MKSMRTLATVVAVFGLSGYAQAGLFDHLFGGKGGCCDSGCDASKCCDCAPCCEPTKPIIVRPCQENVYQYQRQLSCLKPPACHDPCCDPCCDPCLAADAGTAQCGPGACVPGACGPSACAPACPCGPGACNNACAPNCGPNAACCPTGNGACCPGNMGHCCPTDDCCRTCDPKEAYEVAMLIYRSQTACKGSDREEAIDDLGDYDPVCYPEIMAAWIYALNDADPEVRAEAADEIGDALEDNPCLCNQCLVNALICALCDCDDDVVGEAEEALEACGYEIVDACDLPEGCCDLACAPGCGPGCVPNGCAPAVQPGAPMAPAPMNGEGQAPAPAPPQDETKAYFPRTMPQGQPTQKKFSLSKLFSSLD